MKMLNKYIGQGRLASDPQIHYSAGDSLAIARFTLCVQRYKKEGEEVAGCDYVPCVAFGNTAKFIENNLSKGRMVIVTGSIRTGDYINKDGAKVYTTEVVLDEVYFCDKKNGTNGTASAEQDSHPAEMGDGFMNIPEGIDEIPFN